MDSNRAVNSNGASSACDWRGRQGDRPVRRFDVLAAVLAAALLASTCAGSTPGAAGGDPAVTSEDAQVASADVGSTTIPGTDRVATGPNIVVVMTDDQTLESMRFLPKTNTLVGARGAVFSQSFVSYPVCCPSRASFLSGRYATNHGVLWNSGPTGGYRRFRPGLAILPRSLQEAGYRTIHIGKYLNGYGFRNHRELPPWWSDWQGLVDPSTGQYFGFTINDNGNLVTYGDAESDYQTDVLADRTIAAIEREASVPGPFFLYLAPLAPHAAFGAPLEDEAGILEEDPTNLDELPRAVPAPRHRELFGNEPLPVDAAFDEEDVSDKPAVIQRRPRVNDELVDEITAAYRDEIRSLQAVDDAVERIVQTLDATGQLDDTVIVFTSDNGYLHGQHRLPFGKYYPYEPVIRVPLYIAGPGIAAQRHDSIVSNIDLAPTLLDLAGVAPVAEMDGVSLVPLLTGGAPEWRRAILLEGQAPGGGLRRPFRGVRAPGVMYAQYDDGTVELYDLRTDPFELQNVAGDPRYASVQAQLAATLARLQSCLGRACDVFG